MSTTTKYCKTYFKSTNRAATGIRKTNEPAVIYM